MTCDLASHLYDLVLNVVHGKAVESRLSVEDVGEDPALQLERDFPQHPLRICGSRFTAP